MKNSTASCVALCAALAASSAAASKPAFVNHSFESSVPDLFGKRSCGNKTWDPKPMTVPASEVLSATQRPGLGGDYWKVPMTVGMGKPHDGKCVYQLLVNQKYESPTFTLEAGESLALLLRNGGTKGARVDLLDADGKVLQKKVLLPDPSGFRQVELDTKGAAGAAKAPFRARIEAPGGSVQVDDFRIYAAGELKKWKSAPTLFGIADLHTHFFTQMAIGGRMFSGSIHSSVGRTKVMSQAVSKPKQALASCNRDHGNGLFDGTLTLLPEAGHHRSGYPEFQGWPRHSTLIHQQMYVDWLKRAWKGGLRLVHMDVMQNPVMPEAIELVHPQLSGKINPSPYKEDQPAINTQIQAAYDFAKLPDVRDWLVIAKTPVEAEKIVRAGKLAVVLGIEVDDLGDFTKNKKFWDLAVRAEKGDKTAEPAIRTALRTYVKRMYDKGVRHIVPIHITDNVFGGAAMYRLMLAASNAIVSDRIGHSLYPDGGGPGFPKFRNAFKDGVFVRLDREVRGISDKVEMALSDFGKFVIELARGLVGSMLPLLAYIPGFYALYNAIPKILDTLDKKMKIRQKLKDLLVSLPNGRDPTTGKQLYGVGHANARGLSRAGVILVEEMMRVGMVIDVSHMSHLSVEASLGLAKKFSYPFIAGHTGFREVGFGNVTFQKAPGTYDKLIAVDNKKGQTFYFYHPEATFPLGDARITPAKQWVVGTPEHNKDLFQADPESFANERGLSRDQIGTLARLGGMIGIGTAHGRGHATLTNLMGGGCPGSTVNFVDDLKYLLGVEPPRPKAGDAPPLGIALGTDGNGFEEGFSPRFGPHGCKGGGGKSLPGTAVRYSKNFGDALGHSSLRRAHQDRFMAGEHSRYKWEKQVMWWAIAIYKACTCKGSVCPPKLGTVCPVRIDPDKKPQVGKAEFEVGSTFGQVDERALRDAARYAWGFARATLGRSRPGNDDLDNNSDSKAAWDVYKKRPQSEWHDKERTGLLKNAWAEFHEAKGKNPPLEMSVLGYADFDYNLDGMAHYGLMPDMLQDARNLGLKAEQVAPVFRGAHDYVEMWKRIDARKKTVAESLPK